MASYEGYVSGKPLKVIIAYYPEGKTLAKVDLLTFQKKVPPALASLIAPFKPYVTDTLSVRFNKLWAKAHASQVQNAIAIVTKEAKSLGHPINQVTATLPVWGSVYAETMEAIPAKAGVPSQPGYLSLFLELKGCQVKFEWGSATAFWDVNFDLNAGFNTPVPLLPFSLNPVAFAAVYNAFGPNSDGGWAGADVSLDEFFTSLGDFFGQGDFESKYDAVFAALSAGSDGSYAVTGIGPALNSFASLNNLGPLLVPFGFSECGFSIVGGDTLTLTVTHPLDPGPAIWNPNDPAADNELFNPPALTVTNTQPTPGSTITAFGSNFPVDTTDQLLVEWLNTATGQPSRSQLQHGVVGANATTENIPFPSPFYGSYQKQLTGLKGNTKYRFKARCGDQFTWSKWTKNWFEIKTASTKEVKLVLQSLSNPSVPGVVVGSANLSTTSNQWQAPAVMPLTPEFGVYNLNAELSGTVIASIQISVGIIPLPILQLFNPANNTVITDPVLIGGSSFTVRGLDFPVGPVALTLNGVPAGTPNATGTTGEFTWPLSIPGTSQSNSQVITITAMTNDGFSSSPLTFSTIGPPQ